MYGKSENRAITVVGVVVVRVAVVVRIPDIGAARTHPKNKHDKRINEYPVYFFIDLLLAVCLAFSNRHVLHRLAICFQC